MTDAAWLEAVDLAPPTWSGRDDGPEPEHARWHHAVRGYAADAAPGVAVIGFASDEGVRRNAGRPGQVDGPDALRAALAPLALERPLTIHDAGTVVAGTALEDGQERLGRAIAGLIDAGQLPIALGGGHEIAYGSYLGIADTAARAARPRLGVLNLDAHFDLRSAPRASSGTPFRQLLEREEALGRSVDYAVIGISEPSNTRALFDTAAQHGVRWLLDDESRTPAAVDGFLDTFLDGIDLLHLTIDLDVLPAWIAPGVSAPAASGVPLEVVQHVCDRASASGKLALVDVAELNPAFDIDGRTARVAARLIHRIATRRASLPAPATT
ncbi:formimidoylglutamase [Agrococcus sp. ProA11]|uniref:formimidoylglutamase n=1 Tax=Agrococcus chionoecetis TaxID=3153752 RepID=UPI0032610B07